MRFLVVATFMVAVVSACGGPPVDEIDGGHTGGGAGGGTGGHDSGQPVTDAGGSSADVGPVATDAGSTSEDAGSTVVDAGSTDDAGVDAGTTVDGGSFAADAGARCGRCASYASPVSHGKVADGALKEISGLAYSRINDNVLYAHNDSGGQPVVSVISTSGAALGQLAVMNAQNNDWEDIAVGPCPTGSCIYVGEIGDNNKVEAVPYAIYRIEEPVVSAPFGTRMVTAEKLLIQYPGDAHNNAETLLVHPTSGDVYVVTKVDPGQKSSVYKAAAPLSATATTIMTKLTTLGVPDTVDQITAGDIDPCGQTVLLRSYSAMYQYTVPSTGGFDAVFTTSFTKVPAPAFPLVEQQGESVTWAPGGGYFTVSEGKSQDLHFVACQ